MHLNDKPETPSSEYEPIHIDAYDADWIKGDAVRTGGDGALCVRDTSAPGGTRRIELGTAEHATLVEQAEGAGVMSGPVEAIRVECPACAAVYAAWSRGSMSTATCPECGHVVDLAVLVVSGAVWEARA